MPQRWVGRAGRAVVWVRVTAVLLALALFGGFFQEDGIQHALARSAAHASDSARAALAQRLGADAARAAYPARFGGGQRWETGTLAVPGDDPHVYLYVAHRVGTTWSAAIEGSSEFAPLATAASLALAGTASAELLATATTTSTSGAAELSLPWTVGQTWRLTGGPHSNTGTGRPWSAIDFAGPVPGESLKVRAARGGIVVRPCANLVVIRHAGGWATSYYHLRNIRVRAGQSVARGAPLGYTSTQAGCGGFATGPHVHFALMRYGEYVNIRGTAIGGWVVREGRSQYVGCLVRRYRIHCAPAGRVYNDGVIGARF